MTHEQTARALFEQIDAEETKLSLVTIDGVLDYPEDQIFAFPDGARIHKKDMPMSRWLELVRMGHYVRRDTSASKYPENEFSRKTRSVGFVAES